MGKQNPRSHSGTTYHFAKVIDQTAAGEDVHSREILCTGWVIMIAMDGEYWDANVQIGILKVHPPAPAPTSALP